VILQRVLIFRFYNIGHCHALQINTLPTSIKMADYAGASASAASFAAKKDHALAKAALEAKKRAADEYLRAARERVHVEAAVRWEDLASRHAAARARLEKEHIEQIADLKSDTIDKLFAAGDDVRSKKLEFEQEESGLKKRQLEVDKANLERARMIRDAGLLSNSSTPSSSWDYDRNPMGLEAFHGQTGKAVATLGPVKQNKLPSPMHPFSNFDADVDRTLSLRRGSMMAIPNTSSQINRTYQTALSSASSNSSAGASQHYSYHPRGFSAISLPTNKHQYDGSHPTPPAQMPDLFRYPSFEALSSPRHLTPSPTIGRSRQIQPLLASSIPVPVTPGVQKDRQTPSYSKPSSTLRRYHNDSELPEHPVPAASMTPSGPELPEDPIPTSKRTRNDQTLSRVTVSSLPKSSSKRSRAQTSSEERESEVALTRTPVLGSKLTLQSQEGQPRKPPKRRGRVTVEKLRFQTKMVSYTASENSNQLDLTWRDGTQLQLNEVKRIFEPYLGVESRTWFRRDMVLDENWNGKVFYDLESARFEVYRKDGARLRILFMDKREIHEFMKYFVPNFNERVSSIDERYGRTRVSHNTYEANMGLIVTSLVV
jgi:hypothetical protein